MIQRSAKSELTARLAVFPAVAMVGPRQCGKTTLAKSTHGRYYDLEQPSERLRLDLDWADVVQKPELLVLDEAQSWPEIFPRLRGTIDQDRQRKGRFLLLGSVAPSLMTQVSESLAGRLSILELTPFLWNELPEADRTRLWLNGGYPDGGVLGGTAYPRWQHDYLTLLAQRDLPTWGMAAKPQLTSRLLKMLAAVHGQSWNASQVAASLGIDYKTVNGYLDFLIGAFLLRRLQPYQANIKKRLVKAPKLFWRDSGLMHSLLNVRDEDHLLSQPWVGASWEGFVIEQILSTLHARGETFEAYYFRTSDQHELDLVIDRGGELWAFEAKLTASPSPADIAKLNKTADLIEASKRFLVSRTEHAAGDATTTSCNLAHLLRVLAGS